MNLNTDYTQRVVLNTETLEWSASPSPGVFRRLLERNGQEVARATSIVRYEAGSRFDRHIHDEGEEFYVLDGVFSDESGDYPAGSYVRNPPGSSHAPFTREGCTLFVKLRYHSPEDTHRVVVDTHSGEWYPGLVPGLQVMPLHEFKTTHTALVSWAPGTRFTTHCHHGGEEILVLAGVFEDEHGQYPQGTWLRSHHLSTHTPFSINGCTILVKTGHLLAFE